MFQHVDETGKDKGALVRRMATNVYRLLMDKDRLRRERKGRTLFPDSDSDEEDERECDNGLGDIPEDGRILSISPCIPHPSFFFIGGHSFANAVCLVKIS